MPATRRAAGHGCETQGSPANRKRRNDMKVIEWRIRPGKAINEEEMVRSLRERGYYCSGIPRPDREKEIERGNREPNGSSDARRSA